MLEDFAKYSHISLPYFTVFIQLPLNPKCIEDFARFRRDFLAQKERNHFHEVNPFPSVLVKKINREPPPPGVDECYESAEEVNPVAKRNKEPLLAA
ncbi:hypothetical protein GPALN_012161 [Globodera pallida]|nr:hypothetical protein GPALN_012161 [Globodera pallida]